MPNNGKKTQVIPDSGFHQAFIVRTMLAREISTHLPHMQYWPSFIDTIAFFVVLNV